jgi:hypothetical protein
MIPLPGRGGKKKEMNLAPIKFSYNSYLIFEVVP